MMQETLEAIQCLYQGPQPLILDARPQKQYIQQRLAGSVNIPLVKLTRQCYLLPDKAKAFAVVVPSPLQYCATADESQHGEVLQDSTTAVHLKDATSLPEFLSSRGWSNVRCYLQDEPQLWTAAEQLKVLERGLPSDPQQLAQRCLFAPSGLLAASIDSIEAALLAQLQQQRQQPQQQQQPRHDGCCVLRALDVGCGSGRDVAWLARRRVGVVAAQRGDQQQAQHDQQLHPPQLVECDHDEAAPSSSKVRWHVTGIDEWSGALERAADLAQAMQLTEQHVSLACAKVCTKTGQLKQLQVPHNSMLHCTAFTTAAPAQHGQAHSDGVVMTGMTQPAAGFHLIMCCRFLVRAVLATLRDLLAPGGFILYCTFLDLPGVRAFGRPSGSEHLLQPGELAAEHFGPGQGFAVLRDDVCVNDDGRELCWFVARKEL